MYDILSDASTDGVLLIDAKNAFNNFNKKVASCNIAVLCLSLATTLINTSRSDVQMFISGETIISQEGTRQGDPLAMAMYAIASAPLIQHLQIDKVHQIWYADDASAASNHEHRKSWWDKLNLIGSKFGYYPNASKTWIIMKEAVYYKVLATFNNSEIQITTERHRYLGGMLGISPYTDTKTKVTLWMKRLLNLSDVAISQPHSAYAAFTHGMTHKWTFLSRTCKNIGHLLQPLEEVI